jgi:uncharacterized membrane protein YeaQ/YmgE (transglycosylase-associated protein family)
MTRAPIFKHHKKDIHMLHYLWIALIGLVAGLIARALHPGKDNLGIIMTAVLGIAGSFVATYLGQAIGLYKAGENAGFIMSVIGAVVLLIIYGVVARKSGGDSGTST